VVSESHGFFLLSKFFYLTQQDFYEKLSDGFYGFYDFMLTLVCVCYGNVLLCEIHLKKYLCWLYSLGFTLKSSDLNDH